MKVTREKATQNRAAIVAAAERLFRAKGFDGVGIAEITREAGLTHGGFYGHFASKDALAAEACAASFADSLERMAARAAATDGLKAHLAAYLSPAHVGGPAPRCPMAAFSSDIIRQDETVQARFAEGVAAYTEAMAALLPADAAAAARRRRATTLLCAMVGALSLARAVAGSDPQAAETLLESVRTDLLALTDLDATPTPAVPTA